MKKGLGYRGVPLDQTYPTETVDLVSGTAFYMTSDGLIDQIGGEKRRSFGKRRLQGVLLEHAESSMADQAKAVMRVFLDFQGAEARRDDITLMGFKPMA